MLFFQRLRAAADDRVRALPGNTVRNLGWLRRLRTAVMVLCRLCGFGGSNDNTSVHPKCCPICGEAYDDGQARDTRQKDDEDVPGSRLTKAAAGDVLCGKSPQKPQIGGRATGECSGAEGGTTSTYLNLDLQSLLQLIPEQQRRKKRAEDVVVRAADGGRSPTQADDSSSRCDPNGVYIRPRVDPTMRVLKVRVACVFGVC